MLARKNKLSVGDKLTLSNFQMTESGAREMTFDIVGIFSGKKEETFTGMSSDLSENQIFLHYDDNSQLLNLTDKLVTNYPLVLRIQIESIKSLNKWNNWISIGIVYV